MASLVEYICIGRNTHSGISVLYCRGSLSICTSLRSVARRGLAKDQPTRRGASMRPGRKKGQGDKKERGDGRWAGKRKTDRPDEVRKQQKQARAAHRFKAWASSDGDRAAAAADQAAEGEAGAGGSASVGSEDVHQDAEPDAAAASGSSAGMLLDLLLLLMYRIALASHAIGLPLHRHSG